jgi:hypothetical protein
MISKRAGLLLVTVLLMTGVHPQAGNKTPGAPEIFARVAGCDGKALPPWGQARPVWNAYLKAWGFRFKGSEPWTERGKDLGRRWLYEARGAAPLEVLERGGDGVGLILSLGRWDPGDPGAPDMAGLSRALQALCPPDAKPGCPEGGFLWTAKGPALGVLYRPPAEGPGGLEDPGGQGEEIILAAYASADVAPCGAEEP